jgi:hypothetical protein
MHILMLISLIFERHSIFIEWTLGWETHGKWILIKNFCHVNSGNLRQFLWSCTGDWRVSLTCNNYVQKVELFMELISECNQGHLTMQLNKFEKLSWRNKTVGIKDTIQKKNAYL